MKKWLLRVIVTNPFSKLWYKSTCDEIVKAGPGIRVPQQRLWGKNNELSWKKESTMFLWGTISSFHHLSFHCLVWKKLLMPPHRPWESVFFNQPKKKKKTFVLNQASPEFLRFLKTKKKSPIGPFPNLLRKSFFHASWSIAFMCDRGSPSARLKSEIEKLRNVSRQNFPPKVIWMSITSREGFYGQESLHIDATPSNKYIFYVSHTFLNILVCNNENVTSTGFLNDSRTCRRSTWQ